MRLVLALILLAVADATAAEPPPPMGKGCITLVGDVMLSRGVGREIVRKEQSPWAELARDPRLASTWVGNLEGVVAPPLTSPCPRHDGLCLDIEPATLKWLSSAPFRALGLANNHAGVDRGPEGLTATRQALQALGLVAVTEDDGPALLLVDGHEWALVAVNLAGRPGDELRVALERARLQVGLARARTPLVALLPHWGREGDPRSRPEQEDLARLFAAWGAAVIAGSHAHVVQPMSCEDGAAVFFGLGNHLFDQTRGRAAEALAVTCCPGAGRLECTSVTTSRTRASAFPRAGAAGPACSVPLAVPDRRWLSHPHAGELVFVQSFPAAGEGVFFSLRRHWSAFDRENALRPYVFRVAEKDGATRIVDIWRGTALARPLIAARLIDVGGRTLLCAIHRADSFLAPQPNTPKRVYTVYRWTGFGFAGVDDDAALSMCQEL